MCPTANIPKITAGDKDMYKYTYDDEKEPTQIEDSEDRFLRKFKKAVAIAGTAAGFILVVCMIITHFIQR